MKKKGLIISTVVMVVVLIASLTTATYAWFSASATATINDISMAVGASSKVQIGMRAKSADGTNVTEYKNGGVTFKTGGDLNTGDYDGLGSMLNTGLSLDVTAGVGTSADGSKMDSAYNNAHGFYKASADKYESIKTLTPARVNGDPTNATEGAATKTDVIDFALGIRASQDDVYGTYAKITITIPENQTFMGMITALYAEITVGSNSYSGDVFGDIHFDSTRTGSTTDGKIVFYFMINAKGSSKLSTTGDVTPFNIRLFIDGNDQRDCNSNSTGTSATISIEFDGCAQDWTADDAWTKLALTE